MYEGGKLYVFVLKDKDNGNIHGICNDWQAVQKHKAELKNWGFTEPIVDSYQVRCSY